LALEKNDVDTKQERKRIRDRLSEERWFAETRAKENWNSDAILYRTARDRNPNEVA
jgi:hypothetical protein